MMSTINTAGLALIKKYEGCRLTAYQCAAGVWTIGYGHTAGVKKGQKITQAQADAYLKSDVQKFWDYVNNTAYVPVTNKLNENQKSALTSFAFNCGQNNLKTLCKNRTASQIADAILLYNKAGGKVLKGLTERRKAERKLFLTSESGKTVATNGGFDVSTLSTIKSGSEGAQVKSLQILLNGKNNADLTVDGKAGAKTVAAIKAYQKARGLTVDGAVGPNTWAKLLTA